MNRVVQTHLPNIPNTLKAHVHQEGWFWKRDVYDTDQSIQCVLNALCANPQQLSTLLATMKEYERQVYHELCQMGREMTFSGQPLTPQDIYCILQESVRIPLIGERSLL